MLVFLDREPADPAHWLSSPNLVGSYNVFINYRPEACENCESYQGEPIEGFVHLTSSLAQQLRGFKTSEQVAAYLKDHLYLGLQKVVFDPRRVDCRILPRVIGGRYLG